MVADRIVGRDSELTAIEDFLERLGSERALVLRGEPGIGKTTLWRAGVARASDQGQQVLTTLPTESEAKLSYVGLGDLLGGVDDETLADLPGPQRLALNVALLRAEAPEGGLDHRTVCVAVLATLRSIAASAPILVAIDDVQWLDGATAQVLAFVARRLRDEPVRFLTALRAAPGTLDPLDLVRNLGADAVDVLDVAGLSLESLHAFLQARLGTSLPRPTLVRVLDASGGNAFFALEIARALHDGRVQLEPGRAIGPPAGLAELVAGRLAELPSSTRDLLLLSAAASAPTTSLIRSAAVDPQRVPSELASAMAAGVIELAGDRITFAHPLLSSAVYSDATQDDRHEAHLRLAMVISEAEERARHLALAAEGPDPDTAAMLEEAAGLAQRRGAPGTASDLYLLAADLTPHEDASSARRRRLKAADSVLLAGDPERALALIRTASAAEPGAERADALAREGMIRYWLTDFDGVAHVLAEALRQPDVPSPLLATIHGWWAWAVLWRDLREARRHAEEAVRLARLGGDPAVLAGGLHAMIAVRTQLGIDVPDSLVREAMNLEVGMTSPFFVDDRPSLVVARRLVLEGDLDQARHLAERLLDEARAKGDEFSATDISWTLGAIEFLAGNWSASLRHYARMAQPGLLDEPDRLLVLAALGEVEDAAAAARRVLTSVQAKRDFGERISCLTVLGFAELSKGNPSAALEHMQSAWRDLRRWGVGEPVRCLFVPDYVEVLVELGRLDDAEEVLDWLEERGRALHRPLALAAAARCRGLLAAARGDVAAALASLDEALGHHKRLSMPFELARTLLVQGSIRRRARQKRAAREALQRAIEIFERLPAPLWADKARAELARVSGRQPMTGELSPIERRVARLAAAGRTNREIADALFLSARTVAGHLSHVYGKLGIRSRTELGLFDELMHDPNAHS